jgi:DNA-directed RNA polymerase I subunit RPA2
MTQAFTPSIDGRKNICIQLDGRVIGWARPSVASQLATNLRIWKTEGKHEVPLDLEIGLVPESRGGQYPGLFLFSSRSRMMRPVKYLANQCDDQVGPFEQVYMNIACTPEEIETAVSTHVEHSPTNFLSILANLTPFSDFNQVSLDPSYCADFCLWCDAHRVHETSTNARSVDKFVIYCHRKLKVPLDG